MQPLLGGTLSWSIDQNFADGGEFRRVSFQLTTAFEQSVSCDYNMDPIKCCPSSSVCEESQKTVESAAMFHGVLCVIPLKIGLVGDSYAFQGGTSDSACTYSTDVNSSNPVRFGLANAFTCIGKHDSNDVSSFSRKANNVNIATGVLTHTVTLEDDTEAIVAYLAGPQGTVIGWSQGILLPQCSGGITGENRNATQSCSYNTFDPQMRWGTRRDNAAGSAAARPSFHSVADVYWRQFSSIVKLSSQDPPGSGWTLGKQTPALETFVSVCAAADCTSTKPIQNFFSPTSLFPPVIEIAITARTRKVAQDPSRQAVGWYSAGASSFPAPITAMRFRTFDYDGNLMGVYNPSFDGKTQQNFSAKVFTGPLGGLDMKSCFGGGQDGKACSTSADCPLDGTCSASWQAQICSGGTSAGQSCSAEACPGNGTCSSNWNNGRLIFDFDRNSFNREGAFIKLDFSWLDNTTIAKVRSEDRNKTVPLWGRRFTQHVLGTVDLPFTDVDNPNNALGIDAPGDHILYPRNSTGVGLWWSNASAYTQHVFSSFGCDAGTANQPPQFISSIVDPVKSKDEAFSANYNCFWNLPCLIRVYAADFKMDNVGTELNQLSSDRVGIELAYGGRQSENGAQLTEVNALGEPYDASVPGCSGPISGGSRTGVRGCMLTLSTSSANPAQDVGKIVIKCFVAFDLSGGGAEWTSGQAKTCRSLPHCVKIKIDGRPPIFVAPTPGFDDLGQRVPPYSRDEMGRYVPDRTDVPACLGNPTKLVLTALGPDGGNIRIFAHDVDVDHRLYSDADYPYLVSGGVDNADFFRTDLGSNFPRTCGMMHGYGATRSGNNSRQTGIAAMKLVGRVKSIVSQYSDEIFPNPDVAQQSINYVLDIEQGNGIALRMLESCNGTGTDVNFPSCGEQLINLDQVICAYAYDDSRLRLGRWVGIRNPNGDDIPSWRRDHSNGDYASQQHCWRIVLQAPPTFVSDSRGGCSPTQCYSTPFAEDWFGNSNLINRLRGSQPPYRHIRVAVGAPFSVKLIAQDPNAKDSVYIYILEDTGVPLNMRVGPSTCIPRDESKGMCSSKDAIDPLNYFESRISENLNTNSSSYCSRASLTLTWAPTFNEAGKSFRICAVARDDSVSCQGIASGSTKRGWYGDSICYDLEVVKVDIFWTNVYDNFNIVEAYVGCKGIIQATAEDQSANPLLPGTKGNYQLVINISGSLPPGASLGAFQGPSTSVTQSVIWYPERGSEGLQYQICFSVTDTYSIAQSASQDGFCDSDLRACLISNSGTDCIGKQQCKPACSILRVARCRYCVAPGDSLSSIMRKISLDSNWLRLWALNGNEDMETNRVGIINPDLLDQSTGAPVSTISARALVSDGLSVPLSSRLPNPEFLGDGVIVNIPAESYTMAEKPVSDVILKERRRLYVGITYKAKAEDSLLYLAQRFRTTVKGILSLNFDLEGPQSKKGRRYVSYHAVSPEVADKGW
eukprot:CAMPEP_0172173314 /NCGR_PEP_ID=MMETSP1050-20130122/12975_1 /TAXON_ID=233186 /ORGANISM="Cryptomonas curvata, Strain CCAP979/52" /LENGTH=1465 /DNA_ID=CAMNT_0012845035 /DNA_START=193 /DNA_END=4588 /DNA_ORIENTATION=+